MKKTITIELSLNEIEEAVKFWLKEKKQIVPSHISFTVDSRDVEGDWRAEFPLEHYLSGAEIVVVQED